MSEDDRPLNADAIYAAMTYLRDYAESPEGQAAFRALLDEKATQVKNLRGLLGRAIGAPIKAIPAFPLSDTLKEDIYPGEPDSVDAGIEFARFAIWGSPRTLEQIISHGDPNDPIRRAVSRYVADRAN